MRYNTLEEINEKLIIPLREPTINIHELVDRFLNNLDIGFDQIVQLAMYHPEPYIPMGNVELGVRMMIERNDVPIYFVNHSYEATILQDLLDIFGKEKLEKLVYQYMIVTIPRYIMNIHARQQKEMMMHQMLHSFPCHPMNEC